MAIGTREVSIRRADLGLSEHIVNFKLPTLCYVSIRRADLGLSEPKPTCCFRPTLLKPEMVSIRRADLGLSEPRRPSARRGSGENMSFNPPGGFGAFGTVVSISAVAAWVRFQSAGRIWGFRNSAGGASR
ncbi:hypothetical protein OSCT_0312 [Oscillochloris trichoides DG-6]|uniref:Uncharacterized protein n=1 Tax=Oscillochloris trichoides DG-6 TaxID=765420 RepID=E1IAG1_9CHLR|nr:hypothetical protein OSCT_0312 [Oscillochloris trichoides DG-6]